MRKSWGNGFFYYEGAPSYWGHMKDAQKVNRAAVIGKLLVNWFFNVLIVCSIVVLIALTYRFVANILFPSPNIVEFPLIKAG